MTLLAGVLIASVLGSAHCAAMCGAFVCTYVGTRGDIGSGALPHAAYHGGRLVSYTLLGAAAGTLGAGVEWIGSLAGFQRAATIVAGILMVAWAATAIAAAAGFRLRTSAPAWIPRALGSAIAKVRSVPPATRAGVIGLLTTILPCGWLYVFVATAGATGSALGGATVMAVFWIGTVPALLAVGLGARRVLGPLGARLPVLSAVVVLVLGALALTGKVSAPLEAHGSVEHHAH